MKETQRREFLIVTEITQEFKMPERFTIIRTSRWGNSGTDLQTMAVLERRKFRNDDAIRMCNEMISKDNAGTNEELEYEVILSRENGEQEVIHRVDKKGTVSV